MTPSAPSRPDATDIELFTFPGSNACLGIELMLDHAGIAWSERIAWSEHRMRAGLHAVQMRRHGFAHRTAPAARIGDRRVKGSRAIAAELVRMAHADRATFRKDVVPFRRTVDGAGACGRRSRDVPEGRRSVS